MKHLRCSIVPFNLVKGCHPRLLSIRSSIVMEGLGRPLHVLLATTGSVASVKAPLIVEELLKASPFKFTHPKS